MLKNAHFFDLHHARRSMACLNLRNFLQILEYLENSKFFGTTCVRCEIYDLIFCAWLV
jgi:hypothetical protein